MRRRVAVIAMTLALLVAGGAVALVVAAGIGGGSPGGDETRDAVTPVTAEDYCYVEAMIHYRVSESRLAEAALARDDIGEELRAFAAATAQRDEEELEALREWYLEWRNARPAEPAADGPCAGHGAEHADMPGMPSWSRREEFADAEGVAAERILAAILLEQNAGMRGFVDLVLAGDPHPRVVSSAEDVRERAAADDAPLAEISASAG